MLFAYPFLKPNTFFFQGFSWWLVGVRSALKKASTMNSKLEFF